MRCLPATIFSAKARCAASGRGSRLRRGGPGCSSGSTPISRARRSRSRRWRASSSAATSRRLPREFSRWSPLAQDQYLEMRTLLAGYLLSSQGDRMLLAHSVEGRFPFLDAEVVALANSLPASYKLRALDEKHVLKRAAAALVPAAILARKKQPYRAPDASSLVSSSYLEELVSKSALRDSGVFAPQPAM